MAVTLTVQGADSGYGGTVTLPIMLANNAGHQVAGMQFDVVFDAELIQLDGVTSGPSAVGAEKNVSYSVMEQGRLRVIVAGLNQNILAEGEVAGLVYSIFPKRPTADDSTHVAIEDLIIADPNGDAVPAEGLGAEVMLWLSTLPAQGRLALVGAAAGCLVMGIKRCRKVWCRVAL